MCFIKGELRGLWFDKPLGGVNVPNLVAGWLVLGMLSWDGFELLAGIVAARQLCAALCTVPPCVVFRFFHEIVSNLRGGGQRELPLFINV